MRTGAINAAGLSTISTPIEIRMIRVGIDLDSRDDRTIGRRYTETILRIHTERIIINIICGGITSCIFMSHKCDVVVKVDNHAIEGLSVCITLLGEIKGIVHILVRGAVGHVLQFRGIGTIVRPNHLGGIHSDIVHRQLDGSTAYKLFRAERNNTAPIAGVAHRADGAHAHFVAGLRIKVGENRRRGGGHYRRPNVTCTRKGVVDGHFRDTQLGVR